MTRSEATAILTRVIREGRLAQAYILVGDPRLDAAGVATDCAALLFCSSRRPPCGNCRGCRQAASRSYPDLTWVEPLKKSRIISVDQVREVSRVMTRTAFAGGWKVCVIAAADRMLKPAANALLKTLEEPPDRSVFFLLTSQPQGLLPTVLSRCQRLEVGRPGSQLDDELLARVHGMIEAAVSAARAGGAGKVEGLAGAAGLNEIIREIKERAEREIAAETGEEGENAGSDEAPLSKAEKGVAEARVGARYRELRVDMLRFINGWFRDMLVLSSVGPDAPILDDSRRKRILAASEGMSHADAMQCVRTFDEMTGLFETNMVEQVVLEKALLGLPAGPGLS